MPRIFRFSRALQHTCRTYTTASPFRPGDRVLLHPIRKDRASAFLPKHPLVNPLTSSDLAAVDPNKPRCSASAAAATANRAVFEHRGGTIRHADIIGQQPRDVVQASNGDLYRMTRPTLAEYVCLTPRLVTPLYPSTASLIVSLLDLHPPEEEEEAAGDEIRMLEAGTGHGALTLYLARALHGCNPPAPTDQQQLTEWKRTQRRAVLHTLDLSTPHSLHARKIVAQFRRGVYSPHVEFHSGIGVSDFITQSSSSPKLFTHVVLDLPSTHEHLANVCTRLARDATLLVFNPHITQIVSCVQALRAHKLPLDLERVVEVTGGTDAGGREWEVRATRVRNVERAAMANAATRKDPNQEEQQGFWNWIKKTFVTPSEPVVSVDDDSVMICRPKAGHQVPVGGFVAVWKKKKTRE